MGQVKDRVIVVNQFAWLARDNDRNKKMIVEEGVIFLLLKLLKEGASVEAPIAAAIELFNIANDKHRVRLIVDALGTSMIVGVLGDSPLKVQISVANLVVRMTYLDDNAHKEVMRLNVTRPLMSNHLDLKITEMKGLLCLAKIVERETGEMQFNCRMIIIEITAVAGSNVDLRHAAFKTNLLGAKAVLDLLLRVIQEENDPKLQIPVIRNVDIAIEAAMALGKFACPENFNCSEHSKAIIEFDGVPSLTKLLRSRDQAQLQGLVLLCYLALNAGNNKALEQARTLNALEGTARFVLAQHPKLKDLIANAIHHLILYHAGATLNKQSLALLLPLLPKQLILAQMNGLVLLCYLTIKVGNSKALKQVWTLNALERATSSVDEQPRSHFSCFAEAHPIDSRWQHNECH
ncbi:hypothetical protein NC652_029730 [Populus alba x Populus x berolinensis]|nr:hypothetical protein NC652_029730 [Populus alba x Populus x berolinensis]